MPAQGRRDLSHSTAKRFDVAVAGGGVIGLAVAWRAAQAGAHVVVLDARRPGAAWPVSAGMLAPVAEAEFGHDELLALGLESAARWPAFADELAAASGRDSGYRRCGTLVVARDRDEAEALERELAYRAQRGLPGDRLLPSHAPPRRPARRGPPPRRAARPAGRPPPALPCPPARAGAGAEGAPRARRAR